MRGWLTSDNVHVFKKKNFIGDVWVTLAFPPLRAARALTRDRCWALDSGRGHCVTVLWEKNGGG